MHRQQFIKSKKNRKRGEDLVVDEMSRKLASGSNIAAVRKIKKAVSRSTTILIYAGCVLAVVTSFVLVLLKNYHDDRLAAQAGLVYSDPVVLLRQAKESGALSAGDYAKYLACLLVQFNSVPAQFRPSLPLFTTEEALVELRLVWPKIDTARQAAVSRAIPALTKPRPTL